MKKLYFLLFTIGISAAAGAQVINFTDANLKAKLLSGTASNGVIDANGDNEIDTAEAAAITFLRLENSGIADPTGLNYFVNLTNLRLYGNAITTIDLTSLTQLTGFDISNNNLTTLNISELAQLTNFSCANNQLATLDLTGLQNLHTLICDNNLLTSLNVQSLPALIHLKCHNNQITSLYLNNAPGLFMLNCANNNLSTLYLSNGNPYLNPNFENNPLLQYVCADDFRLKDIRLKLAQYNNAEAYTNSYCEHIPGNDHYSISGTVSFDEGNDGCDASEGIAISIPMKFINNGNESGDFTQTAGNYSFDVQAGTHTIQPIIANPAYYTVSPASAQVTFPMAGPVIQNFCIIPNGQHPDLSIAIDHTSDDFFDPMVSYTYRIIYSNQGTQTQSGTLSLTFNGDTISIYDAEPAATIMASNNFAWNYSDLKPFESREILVHTSLNNQFPGGNGDEILDFTASVNSAATDETPSDNQDVLSVPANYYFLLNTPKVPAKQSVTIYPNPVSSILSIESGSVELQALNIYDALGRLVMSKTSGSDLKTIDVSALQAGQYILRGSTAKGSLTARFIKSE